MTGLIRSLAFLAPTFALSVAFRVVGLSARGDLLDDLSTSLLLFTGPFWLGDLLWRSRSAARPRIGSQILDGGRWAVAVQAVVALLTLSRPEETSYVVGLPFVLLPTLLAFLLGALRIPQSAGGGRASRGPRWRRAARRAARLALFLALAGLVLQAVGGDRWLLTAPLTFALPLAVVAAIGLVGAAAALAARRGTLAGLALVSALIAGGGALRVDYAARECGGTAEGKGPRIVAWNAGHRLTPAMGRYLRALDADLLIVVEGDGAGSWAAAFPRRSVCEPGRGLVLISRWPFSECSLELLAPRSWVGVGRLADGPLSAVAAVDLDGNPLRRRSAPLVALARLARSRDFALPLIGGDFNTPRRAVAFAPLRATHQNAFEAAGSGWASTWPRPLPVLDIDQVWLAAGMSVACARSPRFADGDHQAVVVDLERGGGRGGRPAGREGDSGRSID